MPELTDLSVIRALCEKYDFALSKGFGQNFIINPGLPPKIVDASGVDKRYGVIEIGPGIGVLTRELAKRAAKVVSIEVDERLPPLLAETMAGVDNFKLILQDVLKVDLKALIAEEFPGMPVAVCANLPYYITSPKKMNPLHRMPQSGRETERVRLINRSENRSPPWCGRHTSSGHPRSHPDQRSGSRCCRKHRKP